MLRLSQLWSFLFFLWSVTVFLGLEVSCEPMAAVLLFQEAARRDAVTAELAREVAASLTRARGAR